MKKPQQRALVLLAALATALSGGVVAAPQALAASPAQTGSIPTVYINMTGTSYRTNVANPPVTNGTPAAAFDAVNNSGSHTIAGGAKFEVSDPVNMLNNFVDDGTTDPTTGVTSFGEIRGRGNYTWQTMPNLAKPGISDWVTSMSQGTASFTDAQVSKRPYQFKLSSKHDILGMGSSKTWILLANHGDASLMRNKVAFDLAAEFGLPYTPQSRFVDLVVNGKYLGNYLLAEKVQEGGTRVNLKNQNGVVVEMDNNYYAGEPTQLVWRSGRGNYFTLKDAFDGAIPDPDANNNVALPANIQAGWDDFKTKWSAFESALYSANPDWNTIRTQIDVETFVKFYVVQEFTENPEVAKSSIYFYKDGLTDTIHAGPVWDFDSAMGSYSATNMGGNPNIWYTRNISAYRSGANYFQQLFKMVGWESAVRDLYVSQLKVAVDGAVGNTSRYQTLIESSANKNFQKWPILGSNVLFPPFMDRFRSAWAGEVNDLRNYLGARAAFLNANFAPGVRASSTDCKTSNDAAAITTAGAFNTLAPCRMLDTRTGNGAPGPVASEGSVSLKVTGRGGVPTSGVSSVVLNVTVANSTHEGFITAYPSDGAIPTASNLNFTPGQVVANQVVVKIGADGVVKLRNSVGGTVHIIADLAGFFVAGDATDPGAFIPVQPARILDTRGAASTIQTVPANGSIVLQVSGVGGVPATRAGSVALNVTATNTKSDGHISVYPTGNPPTPMVSNLNFRAGQSVPNGVIVKLSDDGKLTLANGANSTVDLIVDVDGYYLAGTAAKPGMFVPLTPARILDSRTGVGMPKTVEFKALVPRMLNNFEMIPLKVTGAGGVTTSAGAVVMNVTVANPTQLGFLSAYPDATVRPNTSSINFNQGQTIPNLVTVKVGSTGAVDLYSNSAGQINLISDVAGFYLK